ncbi:hypothetical protein [Metapseudomonas resinovorans]|uniref:Uncharacterized protein n=1 Tax=Metapseudomonas resinovorans NBRC 106553 TaxID=1245471 RepID=S6ART2_METRE|nr:hypothetical protein [Pseudomonas resinovorans]BAN48636.1 hypothetical protein PCA10_29040 [Pseudomonas resinovorans NBRC 106553]BAN48647.1 hypothetical protein PCA10_29150 [Pseudomonas resinovorans NBRC 106553]BAN48658.1 hypothetical protein PCA10_29260 [Pseudomonas resinovorans NBRC 106553]
MGICSRYSAALLALFVFSLPALATERVRVDPYIKAGPGYTAATGSVTGYVPTKSNQDLLLEAERKGWLGNGSTKTPVTVKPKIKVPVSGVAGKFKNLVKLNPTRVMLYGATAAAVGAVGWVMDEGSKTIKKEVKNYENAPTATFRWNVGPAAGVTLTGNSPQAACQQLVGYHPSYLSIKSVIKLNDTQYNCQVQRASDTFLFTTSRQGTCPAPYALTSDGQCRREVDPTLTDLQESDYASLDPVITAATAGFIRDILQHSCEGSLNPQGCYDDLQKQAPPAVSGPATVAGPTSSTTGTYTKPDGTPGTTSSTTTTNYNIRYGDNYFDYDTVTNTTKYKDGLKDSEESTTDAGTPEENPEEESPEEEQYSFQDSALPEITPFYEQKYPDGFQGVWADASAEFENSEFVSFLRSFVPSFSGTCPTWSMNFAIGAMANFGTIPFQNICYVFDFVKSVLLVTAAFACRYIMFGG